MNNLSTFQIIDTVKVIAFESEQGKRGELIGKNQNYLIDCTTSARDRRAAFKAVIRMTKEVYNFGKNLSTQDRDELEQAYYLLQAAAVADRSAK